MKRAVVHIVGAGVSGLAAARTLAASGRCEVVVHEARAQAGGRRRSFYDETLGLDVDTGNFPLLSSWASTLSVIDAIGARGGWREESEPGVSFADVSTGERWRLRPNAGLAPWWLLDPRRRGPNLRFSDYWAARRLLTASESATVASVAPKSQAAIERLWRPLCLAALNCPPERASASMAAAALGKLVRRGGNGMRLLIPVDTFGRAFVEPLARRALRDGANLRFQRRLVALDWSADRLSGLEFETDRIALQPRDALVLAAPWSAAAALVPGLEPPRELSAALTVHFAAQPPIGSAGGFRSARGQPLSMAIQLSGPDVGDGRGRRGSFRQAWRRARRRMLARRRGIDGAVRRFAALARHPVAARGRDMDA